MTGVQTCALPISLMLPQNLHTDSALPGNHIGIIVGVDKGLARCFDELLRILLGVRIRFAVKLNLRAARPYGVNLDSGRGFGHNNGGFHTELLRG